jgi:putative selenate reductase FAD-binding subunit
VVSSYRKPESLDEVERELASNPKARILSGGTQLLSSECRELEIAAVNAARLLPRGIERTDLKILRIGAAATFQDLLDSPLTPEALKDAARGMANRNVRNAATVGGNLGANKSCSSLIPLFLVLSARVRVHGAPDAIALSDWLASPKGILTYVEIPELASLRGAYGRWSRTACDLSVLSCAVSYRLKDDRVLDLRIACGGLDSRSRLFPELETLFEGKPLPERNAAAASIKPLLHPKDDPRGSAAFKRLRASELITDALLSASEEAL